MDSLQHKIAERAYHHFLQRGAQHGNDRADWLTAEKEILAESKTAKPKTRKRTTTSKRTTGKSR